jgi:predicted nuclease of predicted toxin-antitoxin system
LSLRLYMDHNVPGPITAGLRSRGVDVLTAAEDGARRMPDAQLLDRATSLGRVLVTQDADLLAEGAHRQRAGIQFAGVIYGH